MEKTVALPRLHSVRNSFCSDPLRVWALLGAAHHPGDELMGSTGTRRPIIRCLTVGVPGQTRSSYTVSEPQPPQPPQQPPQPPPQLAVSISAVRTLESGHCFCKCSILGSLWRFLLLSAADGSGYFETKPTYTKGARSAKVRRLGLPVVELRRGISGAAWQIRGWMFVENMAATQQWMVCSSWLWGRDASGSKTVRCSVSA